MTVDTNLTRVADINGIATFKAPEGIPNQFVMMILCSFVSSVGKCQAVDKAGNVIASAE